MAGLTSPNGSPKWVRANGCARSRRSLPPRRGGGVRRVGTGLGCARGTATGGSMDPPHGRVGRRRNASLRACRKDCWPPMAGGLNLIGQIELVTPAAAATRDASGVCRGAGRNATGRRGGALMLASIRGLRQRYPSQLALSRSGMALPLQLERSGTHCHAADITRSGKAGVFLGVPLVVIRERRGAIRCRDITRAQASGLTTCDHQREAIDSSDCLTH